MNLEGGAIGFLLRKGCTIICTEFDTGNIADVVGVKDGILYEIEIKRSISDFRADWNKAKHMKRDNGTEKGPSYFYFMVPESLKEKALKELAEPNYDIVKKYGLLIFKEDTTPYWAIYSAKKVRRIHNKKVTPGVIDRITRRISSELCKFYGVFENSEKCM